MSPGAWHKALSWLEGDPLLVKLKDAATGFPAGTEAPGAVII
jgi:hypothetical protein